MHIGRRDFILTAGAAAMSIVGTRAWPVSQGERKMYGLIGKMTAVPGQRDALIAAFASCTVTEPVGGHGLASAMAR
jgi:hypothetical protein